MFLRYEPALSSERPTKRNVAPRLSFRLPTFNQRIAPLSQCRDVHVDPVVPPVERSGVVLEKRALFGWQRFAQSLDICGFENVVVLQD